MVTDLADGLFKYEDCLLKHYIRTNAWFPLCEKRLTTIRAIAKTKRQRRIKYFTFCAIGATDVLMLDVAKVITRSDRGFDTVFFFDRNPQLVFETKKRIPGAIGFPGNFVNLVLLDDPDEDNLVDGDDALMSPLSEPDKASIRRSQLQLAQRRTFIRSFPFDVINLDLEGFLFKPGDKFPGKLVNSLRKIFAWQRRKLNVPGYHNETLDGFSLMFTTQIGPSNLSSDYLNMLRKKLQNNLTDNEELKPLLVNRSGVDDVSSLQNDHFDIFFKLAMPKVLADILMEADWYIDPQKGIQIFEYERPLDNGSYRMLHLVMDIKRKNPPQNERAPGEHSPVAQEAYRKVVHQIFVKREIVVTEDSIDKAKLSSSLERIKARRRKYYPDEKSPA